jgi:hypothetical protein
VLAEKAGFPPHLAQTIAYASQYTDDSTEFGKMTIRNIPDDFDYPRWDAAKNQFDPICTAHSAKSWLSRIWKWAKFYLKVEKIRTKQGAAYRSVNPKEWAISYGAPDVGHAEASTIPDTSNMDWKAKYANKTGKIERNNAQQFLEAAQEIYDALASVSGRAPAAWDRLADEGLKPCFREANNWENAFPEIDFTYSRFTWRAAALSGDTLDWDSFDDESDFQKLEYDFTGNDMKWLLFHKAACEQRNSLQNKIPESWLSA